MEGQSCAGADPANTSLSIDINLFSNQVINYEKQAFYSQADLHHISPLMQYMCGCSDGDGQNLPGLPGKRRMGYCR